MSTATESRRRPNIWSYISFGSQRRRSVSLPKPNGHSQEDKDEALRREIWGDGRSRSTSNVTSMAFGQRSKILRVGVVLAVIFFFYYIVTSNDSAGVRDLVKGPKLADKTPSSNASTEEVAFNSLRTTKCSKSAVKGKPLIQYALMIDAGSTGSRIHVYRFNNCGATPELEGEKFKMTEKKEGGSGLSSYALDPEEAAKSLDILVNVAMEHVADEVKSCTPIAVKATAGLRKLGEEKSATILNTVRSRLETKYPFPVVSAANGGVEVMDGKDEGVYAWITTNYLLGKIGGPDKSPTAAVFDLGGGSTQIVFEPTFPIAGGGMPDTLQEGDHKYVFKSGAQTHELYQHSHLGYGLMAARESIHKFVVQTLKDTHKDDDSWVESPIENPCVIPGMSRQINVTLDTKETYQTTMVGPREASPAQCRGLAEKLLQKDASCSLAPCSFNGVHQPSLSKTFAREDVYVFSYFYDRTQPLGMPESFTISELRDLAAKVCGGEKSGAWKAFEGIEGAMDELRDRPEGCLDLSFMVALLHTGYDMNLQREVKIAKKIAGNELGWCLGASLPLLNQDSGWTCKVAQGLARQFSAAVLGTQINAVYHTSLVFGGIEYYFGAGIQTSAPGSTHHGQPIENVSMGQTELPIEVIVEYLDSLKSIYTTESYDLFLHNCNNFTNDLSMFLVGRGIPQHITSLAQRVLDTPFGAMLRPQLDQAMRGITQAPTPQTSGPPGGTGRMASKDSNTKTDRRNVPGIVYKPTTIKKLDELLNSANDKCAVIFFTSATCPPCKVVYPAYDELAASAEGKAVLIKVDLNDAYEIGQRYQIRATPTFWTFLKGEKENEWAGANEAQLRGNITLLIQMANPAHPHTLLRVPTLSGPHKQLVTYTKVPPLERLIIKLESCGHTPTIQSLKSFISIRESAGAAEATLPDLATFSSDLVSLLERLPVEKLFPLVDLLRIAIIDPRVSGYYSRHSDDTILKILQKTNQLDSKCPYQLLIVTVHLTCNLFSSPFFTTKILNDARYSEPVLRLVTSALLDKSHQPVRVAAASLAFNLAAVNHDRRLNDQNELLAEDGQFELMASLLEAQERERESKESLRGLLLAIGLLKHMAPREGELDSLCKEVGARDMVKESRGAFSELQGLIDEVEKVLA
ncbi:uncharacterized protein KY384_004952 [Bacidia gigantensis]|uniref:uncharacterized protein n=1 Tax=Bacidia gigantensis TaxID=2732470 RepID=UPI001D05933B|nr:uncharacterized protein KY384_004952 [Bacidia gigantensis]KAG8530450.1 hypothetical protein KY384_004952 [Bacidia gigantensis]